MSLIKKLLVFGVILESNKISALDGLIFVLVLLVQVLLLILQSPD